MNADIREFSLAWRWTRPTHSVLPESTLAELFPLDRLAAQQLDVRMRSSFIDGLLNQDLFESLQRHETQDSTEAFLAGLGIEEKTPVLLSWYAAAALRTTWDIFVRYWDDFCYPASDDVAITPEDDSWLLAYCHEELFEFGVRKKHNKNPDQTPSVVGSRSD